MLHNVSLPVLASTTTWCHCWRTYIGCECQSASSTSSVSWHTDVSLGQHHSIHLNFSIQSPTLNQGKDCGLHQPHNWSYYAHTALPSVTVPSRSLHHIHVTVYPTHYTNCHPLLTLRNIWNSTCSLIHLHNMTFDEALLRRLVLLTALYKLSTLLTYLLTIRAINHCSNILWQNNYFYLPPLYCQYSTQTAFVYVPHVQTHSKFQMKKHAVNTDTTLHKILIKLVPEDGRQCI